VIEQQNVFSLRIDLRNVEISQMPGDLEFVFENRSEVVWSLVIFRNDLIATISMVFSG
jgi:hypothetical protein